MGLEPTTSSLPRKCSTAELLRLLFSACNPIAHLFIMSGRRGSNSRPIAWKAIALPTELLPLLYCGERRIRTFEVLRQQSYSLSHLATLVSPQKKEPPIGIEPMTYWLQVSCSTSWAKEAYITNHFNWSNKFYNINLSQNIPSLYWTNALSEMECKSTRNYVLHKIIFKKKLAEVRPPI